MVPETPFKVSLTARETESLESMAESLVGQSSLIKFSGLQGDIGLAVEDSLSPLLFIKGFECCLISLAPTRLKTKPYPVGF